MTNSQCVRANLNAPDGHRILVDSWLAPEPRGVVMVFHGLAEHAARYERFAMACNEAGFHVVAHNHRGHGESCERERLGHFADENGWNIVLNDAHMVHLDVMKRYPDLPIVLLGHSMGSYIAQSYMMRHRTDLKALVLSGSTYGSRLLYRVARLLARFEAWRHGRRGYSARLNSLGFGDFNKAFEPARTEFDWLSRDPNEVDLYRNDPLCGHPSSCALWIDLTGGLLEITSPRAIKTISADLPVLITGGEMDPVGGRQGLTKLADVYRVSGHTDVTLTLYPEGRHEMLNETNRDDVTQAWIDWIQQKIFPAKA